MPIKVGGVGLPFARMGLPFVRTERALIEQELHFERTERALIEQELPFCAHRGRLGWLVTYDT